MINHFKSLNLLLISISIISILGGLWQNQYVYDGYHWGLIFTNALELLNGKDPYSEIFLEYGFLTVFINGITLKIFENNIYSLIGLTSIIYSLSLFFLGKIIYRLTENTFLSISSILIIFILYPWPTTPWPNFYSFFFTILFIYFYLGKNNLYHNLYAGLSLALAYLCLTTVYNLVLGIFFALIIVFISKIENKKKIINTFYSFIFIIILFIFYLKYKGNLNLWLEYQTIPFLVQSSFVEIDNSIFNLLLKYVNFLTIYPIKNFILEPQWSVYIIFFYSNIIIIIFCLFNIIKKKETKYYDEILIINFLIFALNVYAQILGIEKLATSLALAIISFALLISLFKSSDNKFILIFVVFFISLYSLIFTYSLESSKIAGLRTEHLKEISSINSKVKNHRFEYFKNQIWYEEKWITIDKIINIQNSLIKKCDIEYGLNLTSNNFFHSLIINEKKQIIPWYEKKIRSFIDLIDPDWLNSVQDEIDKNNIFIISMENNNKIFDLSKYNSPLKIVDYDTRNRINNKVIYIYFPKNCI